MTFKCPLVPLVPCTGIAINTYMLVGLDRFAWILHVILTYAWSMVYKSLLVI